MDELDRSEILRIPRYMWALAGILLFLAIWLVFSNFIPPRQAFVRAAVAMSFFSLMAYINLSWLIPFFFTRRKFIGYALVGFIICLLVSLVRYKVEEALKVPVNLIQQNASGISVNLNYRQKISMLFFAHSIIFLLSLTYYFGKAWIDGSRREALLKSQHLEAEIRFLRSQISPHFLLNTLNNIYALSYLKDDRAPELILKLSEMLRYLIYESNQILIPLSKEIDFYSGYCELQRVKSSQFENLQFTVQGVEDHHQIAPLVLLPFIENIFKHADIETNPKGEVQITVQVNNNMLTLLTHNTRRKTPQKSPGSGFGLANAKQRLQLLYQDRYTLHISESDNSFECKLQIPLI